MSVMCKGMNTEQPEDGGRRITDKSVRLYTEISLVFNTQRPTAHGMSVNSLLQKRFAQISVFPKIDAIFATSFHLLRRLVTLSAEVHKITENASTE